MSYWVTAYLGLGANLPDVQSPDMTLCAACRLLNQTDCTRVVKVSAIYRSRPWGEKDQPDFYNAVAEIETMLAPRDLLSAAKAIEHELGRTPTYRWGPRVIDIDILLYGREAVQEPDLIVPHPYLVARPFAYVPLLEIAPEAEWPGGRPLRKLVAENPLALAELEKLGPLPWDQV
jgi:2-amino-4-hydroxy-6-hydroxymethyldihydropteridine diphosphokinase